MVTKWLIRIGMGIAGCLIGVAQMAAAEEGYRDGPAPHVRPVGEPPGGPPRHEMESHGKEHLERAEEMRKRHDKPMREHEERMRQQKEEPHRLAEEHHRRHQEGMAADRARHHREAEEWKQKHREGMDAKREQRRLRVEERHEPHKQHREEHKERAGQHSDGHKDKAREHDGRHRDEAERHHAEQMRGQKPRVHETSDVPDRRPDHRPPEGHRGGGPPGDFPVPHQGSE